MKTQCFDVVVDFSCPEGEKSMQVLVVLQGSKVAASMSFYHRPQRDCHYARVATSLPVDVKWKDRIKLQGQRGKSFRGEGIVLNPASRKTSDSRTRKTLDFLRQLSGSKKDMLLALSQHKGVKGLTQIELSQFSGFSQKIQVALAQELEVEGKVKILGFSPLFILEQTSFDFICQRIVKFVQDLQDNHLDFIGVTPQKVKQRFRLHPKVLGLSLGYLERTGKIQQLNDRIALAGFSPRISPEDEKLLAEMEKLSLKGEFQLSSLQEIKRRFRLSSEKMDRMLALLIERKKVVKGKDGFMLHAKWLDEVIVKIRASGLEEISIKDFKEMTGLSRKYAIPLLELLDQMRVTRRAGSIRKILKTP